MDPKRVVENDPIECDMREFDEIVFIDTLDPEAVPYGILRKAWDAAMEKNDDVVYKALKEFGGFDAYVLVTPEYWEHYKTQANWQPDSDMVYYSPDIVKVWEAGDTGRIVKDTLMDFGFMLDLNGNPVPRLIFDSLDDEDGYNLIDCIQFIQKNPDLFGPYALVDAPRWSDASKVLDVSYQSTDELTEVLRVWVDSVGEEDVWEYSPDEYYTRKYFEQFREEDEDDE